MAATRTMPPTGQDGLEEPPAPHRSAMRALMLAALGVVFGDIGTSPLYALQTVFSIDNNAVHPTSSDVYGVISLMFWSITLIVTLKYVVFVLRADNDGEGGVMALAALVRRITGNRSARTGVVLALGALGAALFYGDSLITPAISVLSAVEGLTVVEPNLTHAVVPISAVVLALLFAVQQYGTQRVGGLFGPVMVVWFAALAAFGLREIVGHPGVLKGLSPTYAFAFAADRPGVTFVAMGAVVLVITGCEALYADMGHFGAPPIRRAWFFVVFPALTLNYLGQGALILNHADASSNPFFLLLPSAARIPMVVLATAATIIASQAVISGAFSVSRQGMQLGFLPPLRIRQTSEEEGGQIYLPAVNMILFLGVIALLLIFRSSSKLATAYGIAVTATLLITTALLLMVARRQWKWPAWQIVVAAVLIGGLEVMFFSANLTKVTHGGWLPLLVAALVFTVMTTWRRGRELVRARRSAKEGSLAEFITWFHEQDLPRVPGMAVYLHPTKETAPLALRANTDANGVLHERVVIVSAVARNVPHVSPSARVCVDDLGYSDDGVVHVTAEFGFSDIPDLPAALHDAAAARLLPDGFALEDASYFVSRGSLRRSGRPGMARWRKVLFTALARNAADPIEVFNLPLGRTVMLGSPIEL